MRQRVKAFATKPDNPSLTPRAHIVKGENLLTYVVLRPLQICPSTSVPLPTQINVKNKQTFEKLYILTLIIYEDKNKFKNVTERTQQLILPSKGKQSSASHLTQFSPSCDFLFENNKLHTNMTEEHQDTYSKNQQL